MQLVKVLSPELVVLKWDAGIFAGEQAMWVKGKLRKESKCSQCWGTITAGSMCYRPLGNQRFRSHRLCAPCVDAIITRASRGGGR